jgi:N-acetylmuramoyl-L-alanine amidase
VPARLARLADRSPAEPPAARAAPIAEPAPPIASDAPPLPAPRLPDRPRATAPPKGPDRAPEKADKTERIDQTGKTDKADAAPNAAERSSLATIKQIRRSVLPDAVRIVIELDGEVDFRQDRIPNPSRVFVDLPGTRAAPALVDRTLRFDSDADVVRQVRVGRHASNVTRVVLDAAGVSSYSVYPLYAPYRLVIDCLREGEAASPTGTLGTLPASGAATADLAPGPSIEKELAALPKAVNGPAAPARTARADASLRAAASKPRETPPLSSRTPTTVWLRTAPGNTPQHTTLLAAAHAPAPEPAAEPVKPLSDAAEPVKPLPGAVEPAKPPSGAVAAPPPAKNGTGGFTIARQLGLGVSRIVIDAGHGGHDPGAQARGVVESELVLDVALRVEKLLQKVPGVEVVLTRRTDEFVTLQERTAIANREGADLFLSIHANASPSVSARGVETYFLNFATNLSAAAVAARENAASGQAMNALPDIVKAIALNNKLDESRDFAGQVQHAMFEHLKGSNKLIKDLGVKQAPFVVLIGASMPSVLAEISFVTNPQEAKLLKSSAYRQRIAEALFDGIKKYQTSLKAGTIVASQPPAPR